MDYPQKRVIAFLLCLVVAIAVFSSRTSVEPDAQTQKHYASNSQPQKESAEEAIARYNWWLTLFTAILAIATMGLGGATVGLFFAGRNQLHLARAEFNATHRPRIRIHAAAFKRVPPQIPDDETDVLDRLAASLICFNVGDADAAKVEVRGQIIAGANFALDVQRPLVRTFENVPSGGKFHATIASDITVQTAATGKRTGIDYHCIGWVAYWDNNGVRRESGFCYRVDMFAKPGERWDRTLNQEYEYEY